MGVFRKEGPNFSGKVGVFQQNLTSGLTPLLMLDASMALPIALGVVPARSELARRTLADLEGLWNTRWSDGGHDRYHTSGQALIRKDTSELRRAHQTSVTATGMHANHVIAATARLNPGAIATAI